MNEDRIEGGPEANTLGKTAKTQPAYHSRLDELSKIACSLEDKLEPILTEIPPQEDRSVSETQLLRQLDTLIEKYSEILNRISF